MLLDPHKTFMLSGESDSDVFLPIRGGNFSNSKFFSLNCQIPGFKAMLNTFEVIFLLSN